MTSWRQLLLQPPLFRTTRVIQYQKNSINPYLSGHYTIPLINFFCPHSTASSLFVGLFRKPQPHDINNWKINKPKKTTAYIKTLLVYEFGSSWTAAWTNQTIWAVSSRVADPARWTVSWWIGLGPCIGKHASSTGACSHGRRRVRAGYHLSASLYFAVQLHAGDGMDRVGRHMMDPCTAAVIRRTNQRSTNATVNGIERFSEIARQCHGCSIRRIPTPANTMWLNRYSVFQQCCRYCIKMLRWPVHGATDDVLWVTKSADNESSNPVHNLTTLELADMNCNRLQ